MRHALGMANPANPVQAPAASLPATATPPWLAARMMALAGVAKGQRLLDPCAGTGAVLAAARAAGAETYYFELNQARHQELERQGFAGVRGRMELQPRDQRYDVVALNPDFRYGRWIDMVGWALHYTRPGGRMVAVVPGDWHRKLGGVPSQLSWGLEECAGYTVENLPSGSFHMGDRPVPTALLVVSKAP